MAKKKRQREDPLDSSSDDEYYAKKIRKKAKSSAWTHEEDELLRKLVTKSDARKENDNIKWIIIAEKMETRSGKQCRERWHNHLRPGLKKGQWTEKETCQIIKLQAELGNQWAKISSYMPGRSDNDVKNKWNSIMRSKRSGKKKKKSSSSGSGGKQQKAKGRYANRSSSVKQGRSTSRRNLFGRRDNEYEYESASVTSEESDLDELSEHEEDEEGEEIQSESQRQRGERLKDYQWRLEQEKKIEAFRQGRMDCGLDCKEVQRLKLLGLGLGVEVLKQSFFGSAPASSHCTE